MHVILVDAFFLLKLGIFLPVVKKEWPYWTGNYGYSKLEFFLIRYFPRLHFQCYPKGPPCPNPYPPTPPFWPWRSPVLGHIKFASPMGLSLQWWPTRPSFDTYGARDKSSRVLVSSYCCSTYRVAVPFSSLGNFSSSSIRGCVTHPIAGYIFHNHNKDIFAKLIFKFYFILLLRWLAL